MTKMARLDRDSCRTHSRTGARDFGQRRWGMAVVNDGEGGGGPAETISFRVPRRTFEIPTRGAPGGKAGSRPHYAWQGCEPHLRTGTKLGRERRGRRPILARRNSLGARVLEAEPAGRSVATMRAGRKAKHLTPRRNAAKKRKVTCAFVFATFAYFAPWRETGFGKWRRNPSPVTRRPEKTPSRDTLSPGERAALPLPPRFISGSRSPPHKWPGSAWPRRRRPSRMPCDSRLSILRS